MQSITDEEYKQFRTEQKAQREAYWEAKHAATVKVVTVRKSHECCSCNLIILKGEKVIAEKKWGNVSRSGWTPGFVVYHYCHRCRPVKEA